MPNKRRFNFFKKIINRTLLGLREIQKLGYFAATLHVLFKEVYKITLEKNMECLFN